MKYSKYISLIAATGDLAIMNMCFNIVFWYIHGFDFSNATINQLAFPIFINLAWIISANIFEAYRIDHHSYKKAILFNNTKTIIFFFFMFLLYFQVLSFDYYTRDQVKYLFVVFFSLLIFWKFLLYYIFLFYRKLGYNYRNVIIIGYNEIGIELKDYFNNSSWTGYRFKGFFTNEKSEKKDIIGDYDDIESFVDNNKIDELYIITSSLDRKLNKIITSLLGKYPISLRLIPDLENFSHRNLELLEYDMVPVMKIRQGPLNLWYNRAMKRTMDILISVTVIVLLLSWMVPVLFIIGIFSGDTSVFFTQLRSGLDNKNFRVFKFRTMKKNNDADLKQVTEGDHRITKIGKFLRKTSIDELPQFINVLMGDMSVIGPRPHMLKHTEEYKNLASKFMIRHAIKPGITGYAQVKGFRGEIKKIRDIKDRIKYDLYYIENWTIWLDIKISYLTIANFFGGDENAY